MIRVCIAQSPVIHFIAPANKAITLTTGEHASSKANQYQPLPIPRECDIAHPLTDETMTKRVMFIEVSAATGLLRWNRRPMR